MQLNLTQLDDLIAILDEVRTKAHEANNMEQVRKVAPLLRLARGEAWNKRQLAREDREKIAAALAAKRVNVIQPGVTAVKALNEASKKEGAIGLLAALGIEL